MKGETLGRSSNIRSESLRCILDESRYPNSGPRDVRLVRSIEPRSGGWLITDVYGKRRWHLERSASGDASGRERAG
jgi:hypothetical protein